MHVMLNSKKEIVLADPHSFYFIPQFPELLMKIGV